MPAGFLTRYVRTRHEDTSSQILMNKFLTVKVVLWYLFTQICASVKIESLEGSRRQPVTVKLNEIIYTRQIYGFTGNEYDEKLEGVSK